MFEGGVPERNGKEKKKKRGEEKGNIHRCKAKIQACVSIWIAVVCNGHWMIEGSRASMSKRRRCSQYSPLWNSATWNCYRSRFASA